MLFPSSDNKYEIIYADLPWPYKDKALQRGGAERHYPTMSLLHLSMLPIKDITSKNCVLFMWVTFPKIFEAKKIITSWGFEYKTCAFVWIKKYKNNTNFWGMGRWTRSNAEICLLATKGKPKRLLASVHQIIESPIEKHSKKPDIIYDKIIELCGDVPKIELFARKSVDGWDNWGNEIC